MKQLICFFAVYIGFCIAQFPEKLVNEEKCNELGGPGTYEKVKAADAEAKACIHEIFHVTAIQNEIDKGRESGTLNNVLGRYGAKGPQVNICIKKKIEMTMQCLTEEEKVRFNTVIEVLQKVANYVYENNGERVITFVEKGGIECLKSRLEQVRYCIDDNPLIIFEVDKLYRCSDYDKMKNCIVQELEANCPNSIPANITGDLLRFARTSICSNSMKRRSRSVLTML